MPYAFAIPIKAGKTAASKEVIEQLLTGSRRQEYDDLQRRLGLDSAVNREWYFLQSSPEGDMMILFGDGEWIPPDQVMDPGNNEFDRWFREQFRELTGYDILEFGGKPPESLGEWPSK
jgi:hypothetical protein